MRCPTSTIRAVRGLLTATTMLATPPSDPAGIRRLVDACPAGIAQALQFTAATAAARQEPTAHLERLTAALSDLRRHETVEDLVPPLTGDNVMALLGIGPGPRVGEALAHLRELAFDRGPLTARQAEQALRGLAPAPE